MQIELEYPDLKEADVEGYIEEKVEDLESFKKEDLLEYKFDITEKIAESLKSAIADGQKITIVGDYDTDGITSTSMLFLLLQSMGAKVDIRIPKRFSEGYGINENIIDEIDSGILITVDNGIMAHDAIQKAVDKGIYTIITDHHELGETIPNAHIVMDGHIPGTSDFDGYCGAGNVLKIAEKMISKDSLLFKKLTALAAIGTVADVMELRKDNRKIVKKGIECIDKNEITDGLRVLLTKSNLLREKDGKYYFDLTALNIGFDIAPKINAAERMGDGDAVLPLSILTRDNEIDILFKKYNVNDVDLDIYKSMMIGIIACDVPELKELKAKLDELNENITNLEEIIKIEEEKIENGDTSMSSNLTDDKNMLIKLQKEYDNKLKKYNEINNKCNIKINKINEINSKYKISQVDYEFAQKYIARISNWCNKLIEIDKERRIVTKKFDEKAEEIYAEQIVNGSDTSPIIISFDEAPEGILGIIAGHLADKYDEPTFVFAKTEDNIYKGSGRNAWGLNLKGLCDKVPEYFIAYGGHEGAVGASISVDDFDNFKEAITKECIKPLGYTKSDIAKVDIICPMAKLPSLAKKLKEYEPLGEGLPSPRILIPDFTLNSLPWAPDGVQFMGEGNSTIKLLGENNISAIGFGMTNQFRGAAKKMAVVGIISENYYNGKSSLQIIMTDFDDAKNLEIVNRKEVEKETVI